MSTSKCGRLQLTRLDAFPAEIDTAWMTRDESMRLAGMRSVERRRSFIIGHRLARDLAAEWLGVNVSRITLHRFPDGRPQVLLDGMQAPLSASLSHSGDWIVAAVATVDVGVDVEVPRRARDYDALARYAFSPDEVERLQSLPDSQRLQAFHQIWALKEADGKRTGVGFLPGRSRRLTTLQCTRTQAQASSWRLGEGAVAIASEAGHSLDLRDDGVLTAPAFWGYLAVPAEPNI